MRHLDPPGVLLERSFLHALVDHAGDRFDDGRRVFLDLLEAYEREEQLLYVLQPDRVDLLARADHAAALLAPTTTLRIAGQHRRAAQRMSIDADTAVVLVMMDRYRIATVATFDERLLDRGVAVVPDAR